MSNKHQWWYLVIYKDHNRECKWIHHKLWAISNVLSWRSHCKILDINYVIRPLVSFQWKKKILHLLYHCHQTHGQQEVISQWSGNTTLYTNFPLSITANNFILFKHIHDPLQLIICRITYYKFLIKQVYINFPRLLKRSFKCSVLQIKAQNQGQI